MDTEQARGIKNMIVLHHTGGRYDQLFGSYHICIDGAGKEHVMRSLADGPNEGANHTWRRNTPSIGIALCCAYGAGISTDGVVDWNGYPPTPAQRDTAGRLVAKICIEVGIPLSSVYTHAEIADIDGYGLHDNDPDMRWDLYGLGDEIRGKARWYARRWGATYL
ncbi:MAG: peptidoglycan recognition protein family protein [Veillonellaceae bacterium]|nr:peptidoglycan recognition protein family protein [Veillonellaceae bacterium]